MDGLSIGGVIPLSPLDFPDALATVIYCPGDPWGCPFSHAAPSQPGADSDRCDAAALVSWLQSRRGQVEAVVFSGGEPALLDGMAATLAVVRELGFLTGLHTTGLFPDALGALLPVCDWVGLDCKGPRADYARLTGVPGSGEAVFASLDLLLESALPFEVRTIWHPALLAAGALTSLAGELAAAGVTHWTMQTFRPAGPIGGDAAGPPIPLDILARLQAAAPRLTITVRT